MIVGVVVVLAVTFSQLRQLRQSGKQLFPGLLGALAIPCLAAGCAIICLISLGLWAGIGGGAAALLLLLGWKTFELRRNRAV